ncbi:MAG: hypothetical protein Q9159_002851 [Coniocarpon cinnabarinum]
MASDDESTPPFIITDHPSRFVGDTLQLKALPYYTEGERFVHVKKTSRNHVKNKLTLSGFVLIRTTRSNQFLLDQLNEVFIEARGVAPGVTELRNAPSLAYEDFDFEKHIQLDANGEAIKRELYFTSEVLPKRAPSPDLQILRDYEAQKRYERDRGPLTCRWFRLTDGWTERGKGQVPRSGMLRRLEASDVEVFSRDMKDKRRMPCPKPFQVFEEYRGSLPRSEHFTLLDGFHGGGLALGAIRAGVSVKAAFDNDLAASLTYRENIPGAQVHRMDVLDFVKYANENPDEVRADILHVSPPSQAFAYQNPQAGHRDPNSAQGKRDEDNQAASLAISALVQVSNPRVVTMEQTPGILSLDKNKFFCEIMRSLTQLGFSVEWCVRDLALDGHVQHRHRLLLIAYCPGETIRPFPDPTHGTENRPHTTIEDCIPGIDGTFPDHDVNFNNLKPSAARRGRQMLQNLVDCKGTEDSLWDQDPKKTTDDSHAVNLLVL